MRFVAPSLTHGPRIPKHLKKRSGSMMRSHATIKGFFLYTRFVSRT